MGLYQAFKSAPQEFLNCKGFVPFLGAPEVQDWGFGGGGGGAGLSRLWGGDLGCQLCSRTIFRLLQNVNPTSIPKVGFSAVLLGSWPSRSVDFVSQVSHA